MISQCASALFVSWMTSVQLRRISLILLLVMLTILEVESQGMPIWEVVDTDLLQTATGALYQVDSSGYLADATVYMDIINPQGERDFELGYRVELSAWMNLTIAFSVLPGFEMAPGMVYPCTDTQRVVGLYHATDQSLEQFCLDTPFLNVGNPLGRLQRNPHAIDQVFAANRYLIDIQSENLQDISSTFPVEVSRSDVSAWIAHDSTWWDPVSQLPVAQVQTSVQQNNNVPEQVIQMCPLLTGNCVTLVNVDSYVHGFVDDLIVSPDGQYLLWSVVVFPPDVQIQAGSPMGLIQNVIAFQTIVSTGETIQIFDLDDYNASGAIGRYARWSPDANRLVVSLDTNAGFPNLFALFVTFEPAIAPIPIFSPTSTSAPTATWTLVATQIHPV